LRNYPTIEAAARGLLGDVVSAIGAPETYVVVGGWSPCLLNSGKIRHPGTKDVDLLFREAAKKGSLESVVKDLSNHGFMPSAKHEFQLLKILTVGGIDFVFNVDLLHPSLPKTKTAEFVEQIELPVPLHEFRDDHYTIKSIGVPGAEFLFDGFIDPVLVSFDLPDGTSSQLKVPLMREVGTIVTKSGTVLLPKRLRDAFDVFVAIAQVRDREMLLNDLRRLKHDKAEQFNSMFAYREILQSDAKSFDYAERVRSIAPEAFPEPDLDLATAAPIAQIRELLEAIPLPLVASLEY
jgi:hypothetical protein